MFLLFSIYPPVMSSLTNSINTSRVSSGNKMSGILLLQSSRPGKAFAGVPFSQLSCFLWFLGFRRCHSRSQEPSALETHPTSAPRKGVFCVLCRVTGSVGCRIEGQESFTANLGRKMGTHLPSRAWPPRWHFPQCAPRGGGPTRFSRF